MGRCHDYLNIIIEIRICLERLSQKMFDLVGHFNGDGYAEWQLQSGEPEIVIVSCATGGWLATG